MGKTGRTNRRYDAEFKLRIILDMQEHHMDYRETVQKYWHEGQKENLRHEGD